MSSKQKNIENEVKLTITDPALFRRILRQRGARAYPAVKEKDYYFDTPAKLLLKQFKLLRLRKSPQEVLITYKGPALKAKFKKREEINIAVSDFSKAWDLLERLGFEGQLLKEKIRQPFLYKRIHLFLDTVPFLGCYLEIEGSDKEIVGTAASLGLNLREGITENYNELFKAFCAARCKPIKKRKPLAFSFQSEKESRRD